MDWDAGVTRYFWKVTFAWWTQWLSGSTPLSASTELHLGTGGLKQPWTLSKSRAVQITVMDFRARRQICPPCFVRRPLKGKSSEAPGRRGQKDVSRLAAQQRAHGGRIRCRTKEQEGQITGLTVNKSSCSSPVARLLKGPESQPSRGILKKNCNRCLPSGDRSTKRVLTLWDKCYRQYLGWGKSCRKERKPKEDKYSRYEKYIKMTECPETFWSRSEFLFCDQ